MTCSHYAAFRASLEARAHEAAVLTTRPANLPAFQQALALARYHREHCPDCDAEMIAAFPELAGVATHNEILSHQVVAEEEV